MTDAHTLTREQVISLFEQIEEQREYIRQLEAVIVPEHRLPEAWRLSPMEERFLLAIRAVGSRFLCRDRAMFACYDVRDDLPDHRVLHVRVASIRRKLSAAGISITIEAWPYYGWRLTPESCAIFDAAVAAEQARWPALKKAA